MDKLEKKCEWSDKCCGARTVAYEINLRESWKNCDLQDIGWILGELKMIAECLGQLYAIKRSERKRIW